MTLEQINDLSDDWKNVVVSEGTLKNSDLARKFMSVLDENNKQLLAKVYNEWNDVIDSMGTETEDLVGSNELVDTLFTVLNGIAPEGFYFGASDGDGACFGFFEAESFFEEDVTQL